MQWARAFKDIVAILLLINSLSITSQSRRIIHCSCCYTSIVQ
uniref:Uncharacterized protein n=1 Tax=Arundo donax TaxID=35708 RepID=A0A0A9FAG8_ARUDO